MSRVRIYAGWSYSPVEPLRQAHGAFVGIYPTDLLPIHRYEFRVSPTPPSDTEQDISMISDSRKTAENRRPSRNSKSGDIRRRSFLQLAGVSLAGITGATQTASASSGIDYSFTAGRLYVWNSDEVVAEGAQQDALIETVKELDIAPGSIFLSWGGLTSEQRDPATNQLADFAGRLYRDTDTLLCLTTGLSGQTAPSDVLSITNEMQQHDDIWNGIHWNIENPGATEDEMVAFLQQYENTLSEVDTGATPLIISLSMNFFMSDATEYAAATIRDHSEVDEVVLLCFDDRPDVLRDKIKIQLSSHSSSVADESSQYYSVGYELQEGLSDTLTFWDNPEDLGTALADIQNNPPIEGTYVGNALHDYSALPHYQD